MATKEKHLKLTYAVHDPGHKPKWINTYGVWSCLYCGYVNYKIATEKALDYCPHTGEQNTMSKEEQSKFEHKTIK